MKICGKKWIEVNDLSRGQYFARKICNYSDAYIVVKEIISVRITGNTDIGQKDVVF